MRHRHRGQAAIEALAVVPLLALVIVMAWQLAVIVRGAVMANDEVRAKALQQQSGAATVTVGREIPSLVPGTRRLTVVARARVDVP